MSQTIRRKQPTARKVAAQASNARKVRSAKAKTGSMMDALMSWVPLSEHQLHQVFLFLILAVAAVVAWTVASLAGLPQLAAHQFAIAAADTGFAVDKVEVRGVKQLNELKVYERVEGAIGQPMPELDVDRIRADLVQLSWVEDARVSRQLPDRLVIDIVERTPHAVLRKADKLVLIDATGHELEAISPQRAQGELVVSGPGAGKQVVALSKLLEAAPALKPQVTEAEWIGNRRWNLTFGTGQVLALPEGEDLSANALMSFARLDGTNRLLGGKATAFDMRAPDRIYFRLPDRAKDAEAAAIAGKAAEAQAAAKTDAGAVAIDKPEVKLAKADTETEPKAASKAGAKPAEKPAAKIAGKAPAKPETRVAKAEPKTVGKPKSRKEQD